MSETITIEEVINEIENPTFDIEVEVIERRDPRTIQSRTRISMQEWDDYYQTPRIYIYPKGESILENFFFGRHNRPYKMYRKHILPTVFEQLGWPADTKVRWSTKAGCRMCPCSPGFIVTLPTIKDRYDYHETMNRHKHYPPRPSCLKNEHAGYDIRVTIAQAPQ